MRISAAIRVSGALWFVPAVFALQTLILLGETATTGYVQSDYARAVAYGLYPAGPLLAGVAAYKFHGFRRFHSVAPQLRFGVALRAYAPLVGGTVLAVLMAMILRVVEVPTDVRTLVILGLAAMTLAVCGLWGLAAAWTFPTVLAVPVAMALPFYWIAYTPSMGGAIYRQLSPEIPCCRVDMQLSPTFMLGLGSLTSLLLIGLAASLLPRRWSVLPRAASLVTVTGVIVTSVFLSIVLVRSRGMPVPESIDQPRTTRLVCITRFSQETCVWPEQLAMARAVAPEIQNLNERLRAWGMPVVDGVNQATPVGGQIAVRTATVGFETRNDMLLFVGAGYVAREARCLQGLRGDKAADERVAAIALSMGWSPSPNSIPPEAVAVAQTNVEGDRHQFADWFYSEIGQIGCARPR